MISAIFAMDENYGIGLNGSLPWPKNSKDFRWFKSNTINSTVVMGRNTWDDPMMPKPLPNRKNIVITSRKMNVYEDTTPISITDARAWLTTNSNKNIFIIGGAKVLNEYWDLVERFYVSIIPNVYNCDTFIDEKKVKDLQSKNIRYESDYEDLKLRIFE